MSERRLWIVLAGLLLFWALGHGWLDRQNALLSLKVKERGEWMTRYEALRKKYGLKARQKAWDNLIRYLTRRGVNYTRHKDGRKRVLEATLDKREAEIFLNRVFQTHLVPDNITVEKTDAGVQVRLEVRL